MQAMALLSWTANSLIFARGSLNKLLAVFVMVACGLNPIHSPVSACGASTGFDCGEPICLR